MVFTQRRSQAISLICGLHSTLVIKTLKQISVLSCFDGLGGAMATSPMDFLSGPHGGLREAWLNVVHQLKWPEPVCSFLIFNATLDSMVFLLESRFLRRL